MIRSMGILSLIALLCLWPATAGAETAHPCDSPNILFNCGFDSFVRVTPNKEVPVGWTFFQLAGNPAFDQSPDTFWGAPALRIWSDGEPFTAGLYQTVQGVAPGTLYRARIGWAASNVGNMERRLGIDPTGGSDPASSTVVWGPSCWDTTRMPDLTVESAASGSSLTVFVWVHHPQSYGQDQVFLDAVSLAPMVTLERRAWLPRVGG